MEKVRAHRTDPLKRLLLPLLILGCTGGEDLILPGDGEPAAIEVVEGDGQSGRVGEPLTDPLVVRVTDSRGRPVEGTLVAFEFTSGGPGAEVVPPEATTNSEGVADARVVLGTTVGLQAGMARVVTEEGRPPIEASFTATALSESANSVEAVAGQDQTGHVGQPLDQRLVVEVTDAFGNPVPGVPITWTAEGGGTVVSVSAETDEDGRARAERTLGPTVGRQSTLASSEGLAGSPVTFVHTALAGDASRLIVESGNDQTAEVGSTLPARLVVRLVDAADNGVPNTAVSWVVATGGGSANPVTSTTDGEGRTSTSWTLGETLGGQRVDAVVSGVGFVSYSATATAGAPAALFIQTQPSATASNGLRLAQQPVIQVRDAKGNDVAVAGIQVSVAIGSGGGELSGTGVRGTDAAGRATFTDLAISGAPGTRTLVFTAPSYAGVESSGISVAAIPTTTTITSDSPDPSTAGIPFIVAFRVASAGPTPGGTVTVTASGEAATCTGGLTGGAGSCPLTLTAPGDRTLTATYSGAPGLLASSGTAPHRVDPAPVPNQPPTAAFTFDCDELTCRFNDASSDGDGRIESRAWSFGDGNTSDERNPGHTYAAGGTYQVTLTVTDDDGASASRTQPVTATPPPQLLEIQTQPSGSATVGVAFDRQPVVQLRSGSNDLAQAGVAVSVSVASGAGNLGGSTVATTDGAGRASFANLNISGATGAHSLRFTAPGFAEVISNTINVVKASSTTEITSDEPDPSIAGSEITVEVQVSSDIGVPTGTVTVSVSGASPPPPCIEPLSDGTATCPFTLNVVGNREFTAAYSGDGLRDGSQDQEQHQVDPVPPPPNQPPTAAFTPPSCTTNVSCEFSGGESTDSDGTIESWTWDFGDGTAPETVQNPVHSHTYDSASGSPYSVTLTVTDNDGDGQSVTHDVTVTD